MERQFPQLGEGIEWNIVARQTLQGQRITAGFREWWYIPPQSYLIDSYVCQVGIRNDRGMPHWWLGAWASMLLPISPSSTTEFVSAVAASGRKCRLGVLNLLIFPKLVKPWILELQFPRWHEQIYLEVWRYDGADLDQFQRIGELGTQLEQLLDVLDEGL